MMKNIHGIVSPFCWLRVCIKCWIIFSEGLLNLASHMYITIFNMNNNNRRKIYLVFHLYWYWESVINHRGKRYK